MDTLRSQQAFLLPADEAIYGLGQHQQGLMNYGGSSVRLLQENREVAVPLLVSSRGYGVLWDNPAVTIVNVGANEAETIPPRQLFNDDGRSGGLSASYFRGENLDEIGQKRSFRGMTKEHIFHVVWVSPGHGIGLPSTSAPDVVVHYRGESLKVRPER